MGDDREKFILCCIQITKTRLTFCQCFISHFSSGYIPGQIANKFDGIDIILIIILSFVSDPNNCFYIVAFRNRDNEFTYHLCMSRR